jgi:hypothetical protein
MHMNQVILKCWVLLFLIGVLVSPILPAVEAAGTAPAETTAPAKMVSLNMRLSWGHQFKAAQPFWFRLLTHDVSVTDLNPFELEASDRMHEGVLETRAGDGDVDGVDFKLVFPERSVSEIKSPQQIWKHLFEHSDAETVDRLRQDAGFRPDTRKLTVQMNAEGTRGFSVTVDQLLTHRTFWVPELDVFLSSGDEPPSFAEHQKGLQAQRGRQVLDQIERGPEATYEEYASRWEDMGSPAYRNSHSVGPGHIVCLSWDSSIPKFGIDRGANVWNDYGNPDHFNLEYDFGILGPSQETVWKGQKLANGLPVITTSFERDGVRCQVEQFAYPLHGPPAKRRGDIGMVLLQKIRFNELEGKARSVKLGMIHRRELADTNVTLLVRSNASALVWEDAGKGKWVFCVEGENLALATNSVSGSRWQTNRMDFAVTLGAYGAREFVVKLPSPGVDAGDREDFLRLDYDKARETTLEFWSDYLARGADFVVPEEAVNALFRANLWHALRLPRRHGGSEPGVTIDLPYSNFAYDQQGTPWPVNQAVYVDYMLYDLRGYHALSAEELSAMFRNNQGPNGHVGGFANWGVYTPGMLYSVAKHYLLSGDRASLETILPQTMRALDWCLEEMKRAGGREGTSRGLVLAPLNDLSHEGSAWAFNQAYFYAGTELLSHALARIQHPRAEECQAAARTLHDVVQSGFGHATMQSPLVKLRDQSWVPYVPSDALKPGRLFEIWYPTDVDTGPLHLSRLRALDPHGPLTTFLLSDHEDNLFYDQRGMANEPVYNQHATAYLLRDDVKPAIRTFYSMMTCAFSHSVFEPVEHRWGWGQYFGPPSTDGAWFELYRNMLIHERDDDTLLVCQAAPRKWFESGKKIQVERAPTYYGPIGFAVESRAGAGEIVCTMNTPWRQRPAALLVRLRHPEAKPIASVAVNGRAWTDFDRAKEWIRIPTPGQEQWRIAARY